jgi:glucose-6-phosphate isomerase
LLQSFVFKEKTKGFPRLSGLTTNQIPNYNCKFAFQKSNHSNQKIMPLQNINPTTTSAWQKLQQHFSTMQHASMKEMFEKDHSRASQFNLQWNDFLVDYSKNIINKETMDLLLELANEVDLQDAIAKYFGGAAINQTENRAVLHTALRGTKRYARNL